MSLWGVLTLLGDGVKSSVIEANQEHIDLKLISTTMRVRYKGLLFQSSMDVVHLLEGKLG